MDLSEHGVCDQLAISQFRELSPDDKQQALLKISQFVLREPTANIRDSLYRQMLEIEIGRAHV